MGEICRRDVRRGSEVSLCSAVQSTTISPPLLLRGSILSRLHGGMPPKRAPRNQLRAGSSSSNLQTQQFLPLTNSTPRLMLYAQTHHRPNGEPVSLLPLITNQTGVTHVIIAAVHINQRPENITLNDHRPDHPRFHGLWSEVAWLQGAGIKVMMMLGGAAKG